MSVHIPSPYDAQRTALLPSPRTLAAPGADASPDNKIPGFFAWLFQNLFHTRAHWTKCSEAGEQKPRVCGAFARAL
jgi:hypothetical protein